MTKKGVNIYLRKKNHCNRILNIIRNIDNTSRYEIKKISKYSMSTVLTVVDELIKQGLIIESGMGESKGSGRKPIWLDINPDGGYFIGIEFNAEYIHSVILNFSGKIIYSNKSVIQIFDDNPERLLHIIKESIIEMISFLDTSKEKIFGIGIGAPGYVDTCNGRLIFYTHMKNWNNLDIKNPIEKEFGIKVTVENNISVMTLAYKWLRPDLYSMNFIIISIRTGIKMSLMLNGQVYKGNNNMPGEIGHIRVRSSIRPCLCGKKGCLDTEVSNEAIRAKIIEGIECNKFTELFEMVDNNKNLINISTFVESVKRGHKDSIELYNEVCKYLGEVICHVINILNPSQIIISGEITKAGSDLLNIVTEYLKSEALFINTEEIKVDYSTFGDNIGAVGAAALVIQHEFEFTSGPV